MYQAILCDDNEIILEGLSQQVDWAKMNIRLAGVASNGEEGLRLIQEIRPDLLITDIRMPYINGLKLTEIAKELNPALAAVIISGYDDFEYARTAMHLGVTDYVLKPIHIDEMMEAIKTALETCRKAHQEHRLGTEELLRRLLEQSSDAESVAQQAGRLKLDRTDFCCVMEAVVQEKNLHQLPEDVQYSMELRFSQLLKQLEDEKTFIVNKNYARCQLFLLGRTKSELERQRKQIVSQVRKQFPVDYKKGEYHADVTIASGNIQKGLEKAALSGEQCASALKHYFIKGANATIFYEEVENYGKVFEQQKGEKGSFPDIDFLTPLKAQDKKEIEKRLEALKEQLSRQGGDSFLYMTFKVGGLYTRLVKELGEAGIDIGELFENPIEEFKKVTSSGTLDTVIENLRETLFVISDYIKVNKSKYGRVIDEAVAYIQAHFHEPAFSIDQVARAVSLSTSYFSTIFRSETGCTFTDYLIRIRMNKAKELMENTNMKIYEVSYHVGYDNAAYFSAAFKKYVGVSPSEYLTKTGRT